MIETVRAAALEGARAALEMLATSVPARITRLAVRQCPQLPATIEATLRDNRAQTQADSVMYRRALAQAAEERGWAVHWYDPASVAKDAATSLGKTRRGLEAMLRAFGRALGPPWQARHVLGASAALVALGAPRRRG